MTVEERLSNHLNKEPQVDPSAYVARGAILVGDVRLGPKSSVWHNCVLRGDINSIEIGEGSNVQDGTMVHLADNFGVKVGKYVTIGHAAMIHACTIGDECLIGMGSLVMDRAVLEPRVLLGAGGLVPEGRVLRSGWLYLGRPAQPLRPLTPEELAHFARQAENYVRLAAEYRAS